VLCSGRGTEICSQLDSLRSARAFENLSLNTLIDGAVIASQREQPSIGQLQAKGQETVIREVMGYFGVMGNDRLASELGDPLLPR
jgi:hypothetical protein